MANSVLVDMAQGIVDALNTYTFSQLFTAVRSYSHWSDDFKAIDELNVDVIPFTYRAQQDSRSTFQYNVEVHILIRYRFGDSHIVPETGRVATSDVDALVVLAQEIDDLFKSTQQEVSGVRMCNVGDAYWEKSDPVGVFNPKHLRDRRQFTCLLSVIHAVSREVIPHS